MKYIALAVLLLLAAPAYGEIWDNYGNDYCLVERLIAGRKAIYVIPCCELPNGPLCVVPEDPTEKVEVYEKVYNNVWIYDDSHTDK